MNKLKTVLLTALLASAGAALAVGAPAGSTITNTGTFEYTDDAGTPQAKPSNALSVTVTQVYAVQLGANGDRTNPGEVVNGDPGKDAELHYTLTNTGNGADTYTLTTDDGAGGAVSVTYYIVNGTTRTAVTNNQITLPADGSVNLIAVFAVPTGAGGAQNFYVNPTATSSGSTAANPVTDGDNVHEVSTRSIHNLTFTTDNSLTVTSPGAVNGAHTLTNTGNTPIVGGDLAGSGALADAAGVLSGVTYMVSDGVSSGAGAATLTAALQNYLSKYTIAAGSSVTVTAAYTAAIGKNAGDAATDALRVYFAGATSSTDEYVIGAGNAPTATDTVTVVKGAASVLKSVENCHLDPTCAAPSAAPSGAKPGEYLRYTVTVSNTGTAGLKFPAVKDYVPANTVFVKLSGASSAGTVLYSLDKTSWNAAVPTGLATSSSDTSGPFVYVGLDSNSSGAVDAADSLAPNATLTLIITVKVRDTGSSN